MYNSQAHTTFQQDISRLLNFSECKIKNCVKCRNDGKCGTCKPTHFASKDRRACKGKTCKINLLPLNKKIKAVWYICMYTMSRRALCLTHFFFLSSSHSLLIIIKLLCNRMWRHQQNVNMSESLSEDRIFIIIDGDRWIPRTNDQ